MLTFPLAAFIDAFRLKPNHELGIGLLVDVIGNGFEASGEPFWVWLPVTHCVVPVLARGVVSRFSVPTCIEPKCLGLQAKKLCPLDEGDSIFCGHAGVFVAWSRVAPIETSEHGVPCGLTINLPRVVSQHKAAESVMSGHAVALPKEQANANCTDAFTWQ